ncbi:alpha/beta-type small acid-soluble spore protein [Haloimpatiens lingqiaonensis]|uniref:alpha/beta-type small acid-soluble spore protein n=1 Tax=Haloimpatiens lingqiaonensis TaxID=1380675 RepID=UPI0010FDA814|nr:alpha/beta-type small acid-soluble spore protein [Haloimpatiens lingqiaonensis]
MSRKRHLVPNAAAEMESFKIEVAKELGLIHKNSPGMDSGDPTLNVGGEMVRRMVKKAEEKMTDRD